MRSRDVQFQTDGDANRELFGRTNRFSSEMVLARSTQRKHFSTNTPLQASQPAASHSSSLNFCAYPPHVPFSPDLMRVTHARPLTPQHWLLYHFGVVLARVRVRVRKRDRVNHFACFRRAARRKSINGRTSCALHTHAHLPHSTGFSAIRDGKVQVRVQVSLVRPWPWVI